MAIKDSDRHRDFLCDRLAHTPRPLHSPNGADRSHSRLFDPEDEPRRRRSPDVCVVHPLWGCVILLEHGYEGRHVLPIAVSPAGQASVAELITRNELISRRRLKPAVYTSSQTLVNTPFRGGLGPSMSWSNMRGPDSC